jgi:hypothetical protein
VRAADRRHVEDLTADQLDAIVLREDPGSGQLVLSADVEPVTRRGSLTLENFAHGSLQGGSLRVAVPESPLQRTTAR